VHAVSPTNTPVGDFVIAVHVLSKTDCFTEMASGDYQSVTPAIRAFGSPMWHPGQDQLLQHSDRIEGK